MLVLHDPATLAHETIELLGAKLVPALESPARISAILESIQVSDTHDVQTIELDRDAPSSQPLLHALSSTHDAGYLHHLQHAHSSWVAEGLIDPHESILPECFPFPSAIRTGHEKDHYHHPGPPKDIFARAGFYAFDMSTGICTSTWRSALASANLAAAGVTALFPSLPHHNIPHSSSSCSSFSSYTTTTTPPPSPPPPAPSTVLALCRPPGHHCDTRRAGGYCYLNNAVIAVETFRTHLSSSPRTAILDLDFHHGNGTQEAFYADPTVLYISIHGQDEYPYYTGSAAETGAGDGQGTTINLPLLAGSSAQQYLQELEVGLSALADFRPDFVVLSLGFDTFHLDPLGSFRIETDDYATIAGRVSERLNMLGRAVADGSSSATAVPCLILLEGGYVIEKLGSNLLSFLNGWEESTRNKPLTE